MATSVTVKNLREEVGIIRRAMREGDELAVTFHSKPLARIVPDERWEQTQAELARLRQLVAEHGLDDQPHQVLGQAPEQAKEVAA